MLNVIHSSTTFAGDEMFINLPDMVRKTAVLYVINQFLANVLTCPLPSPPFSALQPVASVGIFVDAYNGPTQRTVV